MLALVYFVGFCGYAGVVLIQEAREAKGVARNRMAAAAGGSGACRLKVKVTGDTLPDVLTTGVGWWRPDAPAPDFGARDVNINAALSYRTRWDLASWSADTRGIPCRIVPA